MSSVFGEKTPAPEATAPQTPVTQLPAAKAPAPPPSAQNAVLRPSVQNEASRPAAQADMLKPGDALHITVAGEDELSGAFAVNSDGTIRMELLGSVQAAGLSPAALQEQLQQRLAAGYLKNPQVRVERSAKLAVAPPILRPSL
jgi:polysaccharide export outer membrane protein